MQNSRRKIPDAKFQTQNSRRKILNAKFQTQNSKCIILNAKLNAFAPFADKLLSLRASLPPGVAIPFVMQNEQDPALGGCA